MNLRFFKKRRANSIPEEDMVNGRPKLIRGFAFGSPYEQCLRDVSDFLVACAYADEWERAPWPEDFEKARTLAKLIYHYVTLQSHMQTKEQKEKIFNAVEAKNLWLEEYDLNHAIKLANYWFTHPDGFLMDEFYQKFPYKPMLRKRSRRFSTSATEKESVIGSHKGFPFL